MISNSFSGARLKALIQHNVIENKRSILMMLGVMTGILLLVSLLISKTFSGDYNEYTSIAHATGIAIAFAWLGMLFMTIIGSLTFNNLSTKVRRINALMLPASQLEKFMANFIIFIVGGNIALLLGAFLADTVSSLIFGMSPAWTHIPVKEMFGTAGDLEIALALILFFTWAALFAQSLYLIGSALWPKLSFLKTFVALLAIQIILPIILPLNLIATAIEKFSGLFDFLDTSAFLRHLFGWLAIALVYVILAGMYYIAWQIYKRTQVIQKFKNK